jgi:hypothetical protein
MRVHATRVRYQKLRINISRDFSSESSLSKLTAQEDFSSSVKYLILGDEKNLNEWPYVCPNRSCDLTQLTSFVGCLAQLKGVRWNIGAPMPLDVIYMLQAKATKPDLYLENLCKGVAPAYHDGRILRLPYHGLSLAEQLISSTSSLKSLKLSVWNGTGNIWRTYRTDTIAAFRTLLSQAPGLIECCLSIAHSSHDPDDYDDYDPHREYTVPVPNTSVIKLTVDAGPLNQTALIDWGRYVMMSRLKSLTWGHPVDVTFFTHALPILTSLAHIDINVSAWGLERQINDAAETYFMKCPLLETLCLREWQASQDIPKLLTRHGESLRKLQLHNAEDAGDSRVLVSCRGIRLIRESCPRLAELHLDFNRHSQNLADEQRNKRALSEISKFEPTLQKVGIYLDIGLSTWWGFSEEQQDILRADNDIKYQDHEDENDISSDAEEDDCDAYEPASSSDEEENSEPWDGNPHLWAHFSAAQAVTSNRSDLCRYVGEMWETLFGQASGCAGRALDVCVGEWDRKHVSYQWARWVGRERARRSMWQARAEVNATGGTECCVRQLPNRVRQGTGRYECS